MTEPTIEPARRRRRWTSMSLRGLMVLILVVGGLLGWRARRASLQKRAVARIKTLKGHVTYDWEYGGNGFSGRKPNASPPGPAWIRRAIGDEYFQDVATVSMVCVVPPAPPPPMGSTVAAETAESRAAYRSYVENYERPYVEDQLACLDGLDRIEELSLWVHGLKPEGWARLARQSRLKDLQLDIDTLDFEGRAVLSRFDGLEVLVLGVKRGGVGDLAFLDQMPELQSLWIKAIPLTETDLSIIRRRDRLQILNINAPDLTDAGMAQVGGLKELRRLWIYSASHVTERGLAHLQGLGELWEINFQATQLTDKGLDHLRKLPKLSDAYFCGDRLTDQAIEKLKVEQPGLTGHFFSCDTSEPSLFPSTSP